MRVWACYGQSTEAEDVIMKVKDVMTSEPLTCSPETSAAVAARLMWEGDCGILPIVKDGKLSGIVTDRDLYIALATLDRQASRLCVAEAATQSVATCGPEDDIASALDTMKQRCVRRLPVVRFGTMVVGILSIDDVVRAAGQSPDLPSRNVIETLQAICGAHHATAQVVAI